LHWEYLAQTSLAIKLHLATALIALGLGIFMWGRPKGDIIHRWVGRGFVGAMLLAAAMAIFIRESNHGKFSIIHIFVPITLIGCFQVVYFIRAGNLTKHKKAVKGLFFYALIIPGILSVTPGRVLWKLIWGP
jgi:uncharacterized membrane protein